MTHPLIVAQAPGPSAQHDWLPLDPRSDSGQRLARYAGIEPSELHLRADVVNLWPDGDTTNRAAPHDVLPLIRGHQVTVLLGRFVASTLSHAIAPRRPDWFERALSSYGTDVYVSPHPSGVSRFWNDPHSRAAGEAFWRSLLG